MRSKPGWQTQIMQNKSGKRILDSSNSVSEQMRDWVINGLAHAQQTDQNPQEPTTVQPNIPLSEDHIKNSINGLFNALSQQGPSAGNSLSEDMKNWVLKGEIPLANQKKGPLVTPGVESMIQSQQAAQNPQGRTAVQSNTPLSEDHIKNSINGLFNALSQQGPSTRNSLSEDMKNWVLKGEIPLANQKKGTMVSPGVESMIQGLQAGQNPTVAQPNSPLSEDHIKNSINGLFNALSQQGPSAVNSLSEDMKNWVLKGEIPLARQKNSPMVTPCVESMSNDQNSKKNTSLPPDTPFSAEHIKDAISGVFSALSPTGAKSGKSFI